MKMITLAQRLSGGAVVALLSACSVGHAMMEVPAELAAVPALPVSGKQLRHISYNFGEFGTSYVRKGWRTTDRLSIPLLPNYQWERQKSSFVLQPIDGTRWEGYSAYRAKSQEARLPGGPATTSTITLRSDEVFSTVIAAPNQPSWYLILEHHTRLGQLNPLMQGTLSSGDSVLTLQPLTRLLRPDGQPAVFPFNVPLGYAFTRPNGTVVAAVELLGRGRVWLSPKLTPATRGPVAAAVTALVMQQ